MKTRKPFKFEQSLDDENHVRVVFGLSKISRKWERIGTCHVASCHLLQEQPSKYFYLIQIDKNRLDSAKLAQG